METTTLNSQTKQTAFRSDELLNHWQGHRALTRRMIEAFPEKEMFNFSVGGMRPFARLIMEMIGMAGPGAKGLATRVWDSSETMLHYSDQIPTTKEELLKKWDATTDEINRWWPQIPEGRFHETDKAFGQWEGPVNWIVMYWIDNEIHHRGQAYVYLRALGVAPPAFWER